jgi:hypothetical protein
MLQRWKQQGLLISPYHGIYTLPHYNTLALATKIKIPSYISFETVLSKYGYIFQDYSQTITLVSNNSLTKTIHNTTYIYHKLHDDILYNPLGIIHHPDHYDIATPERAICDQVYLTNNIEFSNIRQLNISLLEQLSSCYNQRTYLSLQTFIHHVRSEQT